MKEATSDHNNIRDNCKTDRYNHNGDEHFLSNTEQSTEVH